MSDDDTPAFPCEWDYIKSNREAANGMTLRDYFAAHAPAAPGSFEWVWPDRSAPETPHEREVRWRWHYANLMLKARKSGEAT